METGTVRPLMFGYLRVHQLAAGVTREQINTRFEEFATAEGYALGGVFVDQVNRPGFVGGWLVRRPPGRGPSSVSWS